MMTPEDLMQRALALAEKARYIAPPNPAVGCLIVRNQQILGEGFTQAHGESHAEIQALNEAKRRGHLLEGATVIVTLEPCCHIGRTPPCTDALITAGVAHVIAAVQDPNPQVAGQGFARLRAAGIQVTSGIMAQASRILNIGFFTRMRTGKPWVRLKIAASLDGITALPNGVSQWITGKAAREDAHLWRARAGAILTGINTVIADDPQLTVRLPPASPGQRLHQPLRVILDSQLNIDPHARVLQSEIGQCLVIGAQNHPSKQKQLKTLGIEVCLLPGDRGKIALPAVFSMLGQRHINEVQVEAGATLNAALLQAQCVDECLIYLAPSLLGRGQGMCTLPALGALTKGIALVFENMQQIGDDIRLVARVLKNA